MTPKTPRSCRTIPMPLAGPFKQYRYHPARPVEQIEIDSPYNIYQFIYLPFLRGDFRLPPRVLGSGTKPCAINYDDDDDDDDEGRMDHQLDILTRKVVQQNIPFCV